MFFDEDKNFDNLDDLELDLGDFEDKSITWDELLEEDVDLVSVKKKETKKSTDSKKATQKPDIVQEDMQSTPDVFDVFGGDKTDSEIDEDLLDDFDDILEAPTIQNSYVDMLGTSFDPEPESAVSAKELIGMEYEEIEEVSGERPIEIMEMPPPVKKEAETIDIPRPINHPRAAKRAAEDSDRYENAKEAEPARPSKEKGSPLGTILGIVLSIVIVGGLVYFFMTSQNQSANKDDFPALMAQNSQGQEQPVVNNMLNSDGSESDAPLAPKVKTPGDDDTKNKKDGEKKAVFNVTNAGRSNPFLPVGNVNVNIAGFISTPPADVLLPPSEIAGNMEEVQKLMEITVTGILFDSIKPSAIINVSGSDYFVQKGDRVDNYVVTAITPTMVTISSGKNTYRAGVGQYFDNGRIEGQIGVLNNGRFAGRQYTSTNEIEVNVRGR